jgi:hypothetical protein
VISQSPRAIARHVAKASAYLEQALVEHIAGADPKRVEDLAQEAGQSARFAGRPCDAWAERYPAAWAVPAIREAMQVGRIQTDRDLTSCIDVVDPGSAS